MKTIRDFLNEREKLESTRDVHESALNHNTLPAGKVSITLPDDYMALINKNYVHVYASGTYCAAIGKKKQDVVHNPVASVWGEEVFSEIMKKCLDRCFAGERVEQEGWTELPGWGRSYYQVSYLPYATEQGEITHAAVTLRDITELKQEEERLRKSESDFRAVLEKIHYGVYAVDRRGWFTFVNDALVEKTGYSREWFLGKTLFDFVRPGAKVEVRKRLGASIRGVPVTPYEFAYYNASGETAWAQVNTTPLRERGSIVGVVGILLDITKKKYSEQALMESEDKYRRLFEDSRDAIFITDKKGKLTDVNASFLDLFGYSKEEAIGLDVVDMYVSHDDRVACVSAMIRDGYVKDYRLTLKRKDGSVMDAYFTGTVQCADDGKILSYQGIVRDGSLMKRTPILQFIIDRNHTVIHWNKALEAASGIKAEEVEGTKQHWRAFYRTERPCMADLLVRQAEEEIPNWYRGKDSKCDVVNGTYKAVDFFKEFGEGGKWLHFMAAPIRDSKGNVIGAVETLQDVTEHKLAEAFSPSNREN